MMNNRCFLFCALMTFSVNNYAEDYLSYKKVAFATGKLEYGQYHVIVNNVPGTILDILLPPSSDVKSKGTVLLFKPLDPNMPIRPEINDSENVKKLLSVNIKKGDFVNKNQVLAVLVSPEDIQVRAHFPTDYANTLLVGKKIAIYMDPDRDNVEVEGVIKSISLNQGKIDYYEVEIGITPQICSNDKNCVKHMVAGNLVKVVASKY